MEEKNVFSGKSVDEALDEGLKTLGLTLDEVDYQVVYEGKKGFLGLGSVEAKVKITPKLDDGKKTCSFIDGLLAIVGIKAVSEVVSDGESLVIDIKTANSARVIGKRGDVLDSIQCLAGAVANTGREKYRKVVVDCENYRAQREQTLIGLAHKLEKTAVETGRKMLLEPMSPYERRVIHAALADSTEVKTVSEGREPARYVAVIPNDAKPYDRGVRYGERRRDGNSSRRFGGNDRGERRGNRDDRRSSRPSGGAKRGKKEIYFGTFLGNSNAVKENPQPTEENSED
jgi:spoIIIJ-associated protein